MSPDTCRIVVDFLANFGGKWAAIIMMLLSIVTLAGNVTFAVMLAVVLFGRKQREMQIKRRGVFLAWMIVVLFGSAVPTFAVSWASLEALTAFRHQQG
jgi:hypothetical protein